MFRVSASPRPFIDSLGELESAALEVLWASPHAMAVRDVAAQLKRRPALAYTTVMTVLDRLHDKGFVTREKGGRAFLYQPRIAREALMGQRAASALRHKGPPPDAVLMAFLDSVETRDPKVLDRLAELIAKRKAGK